MAYEGTQLPSPEVKTQRVLSGCPPETGSPCRDSSPKQSEEVSQREEEPRGGDRILGRKAEAQRNVWGNSLRCRRVAPGKLGWGVGTSLGLGQGYPWELGPGKIPLPMASEMDGQRDRQGVLLGGRAGGWSTMGTAPTHSGTPPWEVHISAVLHLCTFTVATRAFKPKYMNFRSLGMIRFNTF